MSERLRELWPSVVNRICFAIAMSTLFVRECQWRLNWDYAHVPVWLRVVGGVWIALALFALPVAVVFAFVWMLTSPSPWAGTLMIVSLIAFIWYGCTHPVRRE